MEKIVGNWDTKVLLENEEAKDICKLGEGEECCAFLVLGPEGFECVRMAYPASVTVFSRLEKGTMVAKGEGGWEGCPWHGEIEESCA